MGVNQSNVSKFMRTDSNGKTYIVPVALPPHKVHSSTGSLSTLGDSMDHDEISRNSPKAIHGRFYLDDEDNAMFQTLLENYDCGQILGKGSSAQVFEVIHKDTRKKYACKVVHKNNSINDSETMRMESEILLRMTHQNVASLHELYETTSSKWFIMEMANGGSLHTAMAEEDRYTENLIAQNFKQVLEGVQYLHEMGIVHRDLKQDNILCAVTETENGEKKYTAKIADFGLSALVVRKIDPKKMKKIRTLKDMWGTKEYFAPEVYLKAYGPQADVWSLGCVLYELLTGEIPFPIREVRESKLERIFLNAGKKAKRYYEMRPGWRELSPEAQDLIHMMLKINPKKRYSIQECLTHPFILRTSLSAPSSASESLSMSQHAGVVVHPVGMSKEKVLAEAKAIANKRAAAKLARTKLLVAEAELAMRSAAATTPMPTPSK